MKRIVIEVADTTARRWRMSSQQRRNEIAQKIDIRLAKELMAASTDEFKQFLDETSATMKQRGLTEEKLAEILKEDE